jgi:hypothetical protein
MDAGTADVVVLHLFEDRHSQSHAQVQVKELRSVRDCPAWIGEVLVGQESCRREVYA